ncbi:Mre11 DNA-binding presumed domain-containing protein [Dendryphion nanum]|uniref:Double-strand break repair protein n=1 Tax=Dendryphion nanum TaxID=256645 RepID=A0A9P9D8A0_9PLEO|nr:Mre11 DNA-binding presumed domain-containing protein [Dendryphion nanum]
MAPRAQLRGPDTIRILVATDSHVGYNERDVVRGVDSAKTFDEVMQLAKEHDVDMVLHAGDLFHDTKPSKDAIYHVVQSLRANCLGDKPCELEMLSDASENFSGLFDHVNYEDPNINVSVPVFAIHGNHDDPSGIGNFSALDLLQVSGLVNYYGRSGQQDKVEVKPVLLQKGRTKLALYGLSNIRDERMFRTFRDGMVKFYQPGTQKDEWFNLMSVHQNHHAYTETSYLPEAFLPSFMDLVVWGHEHECLIEPRYNPEMGFHVMQPGSSVATSLMPGEAVPKHVAILSITGKEFVSEPIRLKTVRPFVMKEIVLAEERAMKEKEIWRISENRLKVSQHLENIVNQLIEDAKREWLELQDNPDDESIKIPLPLVRLRVEYSAPEPGSFQCENPQRFSSRFMEKVANTQDVVQFYRKKHTVNRTLKNNAALPDEDRLQELSLDTVKVDQLVKEFLAAQSLTILPQNSFSDAVAQFVDKDDKHAMEEFLKESLDSQQNHLLRAGNEDSGDDDEDLQAEMERLRVMQDEEFVSGLRKKAKNRKLKPKPATWDSDMDGEWADQPGAHIFEEADEDDDEGSRASNTPRQSATRGRGKTTGTTRKQAAVTAAKKAPAAKGGRGKKKVIEEESEEEAGNDEDVIMLDDDDDEESDENALFARPARPAPKKAAAPKRTTTRAKSPAKKPAPARSKQSTLNFSSQASTQRSQPARGAQKKTLQEPSDDEISDEDDAFEPVAPTRTTRARR